MIILNKKEKCPFCGCEEARRLVPCPSCFSINRRSEYDFKHGVYWGKPEWSYSQFLFDFLMWFVSDRIFFPHGDTTWTKSVCNYTWWEEIRPLICFPIVLSIWIVSIPFVITEWFIREVLKIGYLNRTVRS